MWLRLYELTRPPLRLRRHHQTHRLTVLARNSQYLVAFSDVTAVLGSLWDAGKPDLKMGSAGGNTGSSQDTCQVDFFVSAIPTKFAHQASCSGARLLRTGP